jgi:hypothetical protein
MLALIEEQHWLDNPAGALQKAVSSAYEAAGEAGQRIKDAMHGTWLGHPVHAAVTDVPVGAWTAAVVMDAVDELSPSDGLKRGADAAVAVGLAGTAVSALTGLTDWSAVDGRARRIGLAHSRRTERRGGGSVHRVDGAAPFGPAGGSAGAGRTGVCRRIRVSVAGRRIGLQGTDRSRSHGWAAVTVRVHTRPG